MMWDLYNCSENTKQPQAVPNFFSAHQSIHHELIQPYLGWLVLDRSTLGLFTIDCTMAKENLYETIIQAFATSHMQHGDISGYIVPVRREVATSIDVCTRHGHNNNIVRSEPGLLYCEGAPVLL